MEIALSAIAGIAVYGTIPATSLRQYVDGVFSALATCPRADIAPFGAYHRYRIGHDLLLDVPQTFRDIGIRDGFHHAGHIVLTDFPTKAGIPIPGFSQGALGQLLVDWGIPKGWLSVNIADGTIGFFAVSEGSADLISALDGGLHMSHAVFFDTFVEGGIEICLGAAVENPILVLGGLENIAAGCASTWHSIVIDLSPLDFFGHALGSAVIGALLGFLLADPRDQANRTRTTLINAVRGTAVGGLFSITTAFGFGALLGLAFTNLGKTLAKQHNRENQLLLSVDQTQYERLLHALACGNPDFIRLWSRCVPSLRLLDSHPILVDSMIRRFADSTPILNRDLKAFNTNQHSKFDDQAKKFDGTAPNIN